MQEVLKKILNFFTIDPIRKILALIFAFGLWLFVAIDTDYHYSRDIGINYTNLSEEYVLVESVSQVKVTFSGKGRSLFSIWASPPKVTCSLRDATLGENDISIGKLVVPVSDVNITYDVKSIKVVIDEKIEKEMAVFVPIKGALKDGFSLSEIQILDTVTATGPKTVLRDYDKIEAESLDLKNHNATFERSLRVYSKSSLVFLSHNSVRIMVVVDTTKEKLFTSLPVNILGGKKRMVAPSLLILDTLTIAGPGKKIEEVRAEDISIRINISNLPPGEYNLPAEVILPDYLRPVYSVPKRFKIKIY